MPPDAPEKIEIAAAAEPAVAAAAVPAAEPAAPAAGDPSRTSAASEVPAKDAGTTEPIVAPQSEPSLLQTFDADKKAKEAKPAEAKSAEAKPADPAKPAEAKPAEPAKDAKPEEAKPAEAAKPEPIEYKYTLPEAIKLDDAHKADVHTAFDAFRADPTNAQPLIDLHNKLMGEFAAQTDTHQRRVFNDYRAENRKAVMADPEIGGSGHQTAMGAIARMRDMLAPKGSLEPRKFDDGKPRLSEFDEFLESTGAGDHPLFLKILHNAARYLDEPQASQLPANPRPARVRAPKGGIYSEESRAKMNGK